MVEFNREVLSNGLTVVHEKRDVPVTSVMLAVKYGSMYESAEEKGIAHFMEHLCFKGTEKRTTEEIASSLEKVGGDLNAFTHEEMTAYHVLLPSKHLRLGVDVISDIFFNPVFPEEEVKREAGVICEEIKMYRDNPRAHTLEKVKEGLYKPPYGMFTAGECGVIENMTRDQLYEKHRSCYIPSNSVLCVVGNNDFEEVLSLARLFCGFERDGEVLSDGLDVLRQNLKSEEKRDNLVQSNIALGFHFPKMTDKKYYAAVLFSTILGDGMSSKLFREVREKRGLVYTVKSELDLGRNYGYMVIVAGTDPSKTGEVIDLCLAEFRKMKEITRDELEEAKVQVVGSHLVESEGSNQTAVNLVMSEFAGDSRDFYRFSDKVNEVSVEEVRSFCDDVSHSSFSLGP